MNQFAVVVALSFMVATSLAVEFTDCGSKVGKPTSVEVSNCKAPPCIFKKGHDVDFSVTFTSNKVSTKTKALVHGVIGKVALPFPLSNPDGCKNCNLKCPLAKGSENVYKFSLPIKKMYPPIALTAKWELQDENGDDIFCVEVPAKIE